MIIQGGVADIIKIVMRDLYYKNPFGIDNFRILLQTHDELTVEVKEEIADEAKDFVVNIMLEVEQRFLGDVPAKLDYHIADFWTKKDENED